MATVILSLEVLNDDGSPFYETSSKWAALKMADVIEMESALYALEGSFLEKGKALLAAKQASGTA